MKSIPGLKTEGGNFIPLQWPFAETNDFLKFLALATMRKRLIFLKAHCWAIYTALSKRATARS